MKVQSVNNRQNFNGKLIPEGFGKRSADLKRWSGNISKIYEHVTDQYPNDTLYVKKNKYDYCTVLDLTFNMEGSEYTGQLKHRDAGAFQRLDDEQIAEKLAHITQIIHEGKKLIEKGLKMTKEFSEMFPLNEEAIMDEMSTEVRAITQSYIQERIDTVAQGFLFKDGAGY